MSQQQEVNLVAVIDKLKMTIANQAVDIAALSTALEASQATLASAEQQLTDLTTILREMQEKAMAASEAREDAPPSIVAKAAKAKS